MRGGGIGGEGRMSRCKRASDPPSATQLRHTPYTHIIRKREGQPWQVK